MKNWKVILRSNTFFFLLTSFVLVFVCLNFVIPKKSKYKETENTFQGTITEYFIDGDSCSFVLKGREKLKVFYILKSKEEKEQIEQNIGYGKEVLVTGMLETPKENTIPNTFNYKEYLYDNHIFYILKAKTITIGDSTNLFYAIKNKIRKYLITLPRSEYFLAFLLGDTKGYDLTEVRSNGISHLFAVSGMHLAFFTFLLHHIMKKKKYSEVFISFFLIFYAFLVGFTPSVLRVVLFYLLTQLNKLGGNVFSQKKLFFLTCFILLLYDPFFLKNLGFQYSFCIRFFLFYLKEEKNYFLNLFKVSSLAFLASLPLTAMNFYEINVLGIFLNLLFVPFVSLLFYPLCFVVIIIPSFTFLFAFLAQIFEVLNGFFGTISWFKIVIPKTSILCWILYYLLLLHYLRNSRTKTIFFLIILVVSIRLFPKINPSTYVYFLDVGQGDSALLVSPYQKGVVLIDTGGKVSFPKEEWQVRKKTSKDSETIITFMHSLGIASLDDLILTHGDYDHMGEAVNLVTDFKVKKVIFNCGSSNDLEQELISVLEKKDIDYSSCVNELNVGSNELYFLNTREYDNENDNSCVIYTELNHYKFLLMGDASTLTEKEILMKYNLTNIDVLKVGHHGSKTSSSKEFIATINPKYSLISVGKNNRYGHPNKEVLENLAHSTIYRTDVNGSVEIKSTKNGYKIRTYNP